MRMQRPLYFPLVVLAKVSFLSLFFLGPGVLALVAIPRLRPRIWTLSAGGCVVAVVGTSLLTKGSFAHYVAPVTGAIYVLFGLCLANLHRRARARRTYDLALIVTVIVPFLFPFRVAWEQAQNNGAFPSRRAAIERELLSSDSLDLVLVNYVEGHDFLEEWVYNRADIDQSEIVWARSMGPAKDPELLGYFPDRIPWFLTVGNTVRLERYGDVDR
jgi:hypothetical protein